MDTLRLNVPKSSYVIQQNICVFMCASMSPIGHSRPLCTDPSVRTLCNYTTCDDAGMEDTVEIV